MCAAAPTSRRCRRSTPTTTCSTATRPDGPGGRGETFAWELARAHRGPVPVILSGGLNPDNVAEAIADRAPVRGRRRQRRRERSGAQGPGQAPGVRRGRPRHGPRAEPHERGRAPLRPVRRAVRARDADAGAGRARGGVDRRRATIPASAPSSTRCCTTTSVARRRCTSRPRLSEAAGHPIYLKREDLNHTGAHKINNAIGQALLAQRMGKPRIIAETGAGQHGVAAATACALLDLECVVYMGTEDMRRQAPNVERMGLLGATGRARRGGRPDAQGGGIGRDPRLGHERRDHPLHHRLVRRAGAVSGARPRPPAGDRRRGAGAGARAGGAAAAARDRVRRRRVELDRDLHSVRRGRRGRAGRASRRPARGSRPAATARR